MTKMFIQPTDKMKKALVEEVEKVEIPLEKVQSIVRMLSLGHPSELNINRKERVKLIDYLKDKINEV